MESLAMNPVAACALFKTGKLIAVAVLIFNEKINFAMRSRPI